MHLQQIDNVKYRVSYILLYAWRFLRVHYIYTYFVSHWRDTKQNLCILPWPCDNDTMERFNCPDIFKALASKFNWRISSAASTAVTLVVFFRKYTHIWRRAAVSRCHKPTPVVLAAWMGWWGFKKRIPWYFCELNYVR